jgi:hypothetical protein
MRLAHLILVHNNPRQLERLIKRLQHNYVDIYIQLDKKTSIEDFEYLSSLTNVFFIKNRLKVYWGNYSLVQATLNGFEEILETGILYSHINLLSGQDYPLKSNAEILAFLFSNKDKTFMHSLSIEDEWKEAQPRINKYHFGDFMFPGRYRFQAVINYLSPPRKMPIDLKPYGRSQWFTITPDCAKYVINYLKDNPDIRRYFRMTWAPDEFTFQTILHNSQLREKVFNDNLRYIKFLSGNFHPQTLTLDDATSLARSNKLFARKFNEQQDSAILDYLDSLAQVTN